MADNTLVYLAKGNLYTKSKDGTTQQIKSIFVEEMINNLKNTNQKSNWKNNKNTPFLYNVWNNGNTMSDNISVKITGACRGKSDNEIYYAIETDDNVGALLYYNLSEKTEKRLIHQHSLSISGLHRNPATEEICCSVRNSDGSASVALIKEASVRTMTEGQAVDEHPSWIPDSSSQAIYQSAGIAFNNNGVPIGLGNYSINKIDFSTGTLETILEHKAFDFMFPKQDKDGNLYFIKRPYNISIYLSKKNFVNLAGDIVFFPFRLLRAIFHFLNNVSST
jgi:hypothetical protein